MNAQVINRYTFKGLLHSTYKLKMLVNDLKKAGLNKDDIDIVFLPSKSSKGFHITRRRKSYYLSVYAGLLGIFIGSIVAAFNGTSTSIIVDGTALSPILSSFIFYALGLGFITALLGFIAGWNSVGHEIVYTEKASENQKEILLAANTNFEKRETVEKLFDSHFKKDFEVVDNNFENEVGLR